MAGILKRWGDSSYRGKGFPYSKFRFSVQIDGIGNIGFQEVSGLRVSMEPYKYREGGNNYSEINLAGDITFDDIVMKKGLSDDYSVWNWVYTSFQLESDLMIKPHYRRNISILLLDKKLEPARIWTVYGAIPSGYELDILNAETNEVSFETLTLAHQGFDEVPIVI